MDHTTWQVLLVVFVATLIRSTFGFGEALIAVPLLALFIPVEQAAPLAVLISVTIAAVVVIQDWRKIHLRSAVWLLVPTFVGTPLGVMLLSSSHPQMVKAVLAIIILGFSSYVLIGRKLPMLHRDSLLWMTVCGFAAGVLGGAYGMNGPPLVIYGSMRRWSPQHFRATLQGYFLPAGVVALAGYAMTGLLRPAVTHNYLLSLPVVVPAIFVGRAINHRLRGEAFLKYVHAGLVVIALLLLAQAMHAQVFGTAASSVR